MIVKDPGHTYEVNGYDGANDQIIVFMKREGDGYPGNTGHHGGTNCQELLRVLIDRVKYLDRQIPCEENKYILARLRASLFLFESRAATRHHRKLPAMPLDYLELEETCPTCGHVKCNQHFPASHPGARL